jgi:hypothetical protein
MALWQFDYMVVSSKNLNKNIETEEMLSWLDIELPSNIKEILQSILPYKEGWSKDILQYGESDGTCISLLCEQGKIDEISMRLDLRNLKEGQLDAIIELIKCIDGKILYSENIYSPEKDILLDLIRKSKSARFCINPEEYFKEEGIILE